MLSEAMRIGWPTAFTSDLYLHDSDTLKNHPGRAMLWILREHGTHLYPVVCTSRGQISYVRRVIKYWSGEDRLNLATKDSERARYYVVTPEKLTQISWHAAFDLFRLKDSVG